MQVTAVGESVSMATTFGQIYRYEGVSIILDGCNFHFRKLISHTFILIDRFEAFIKG